MVELRINPRALDVLKMDPLFCYVTYADIRFDLTGFKFSPYCSTKQILGMLFGIFPSYQFF